MQRTIVCLCLAVLWLAVRHVQASDRPTAAVGAGENHGPLVVSDEVLRASVSRIARRSRLWREAVGALKGTGRTALLVTPEQLVLESRHARGTNKLFDEGVLAEVSPLLENGTRVSHVLVVVNLALIEVAHARRDSLPAEVQADLDAVLAHEVYGHALPYLLAGDLAGRCPDPVPGQPASEACAIKRENAVRAEIGLGRRTGYGPEGLALFRQPWRSAGD